MLTEMKKQVQQLIRSEIDRQQMTGCNLLMKKDSEELFYCEDGYADLESGTAIRRDTLFRIYSMTKPITAAAIMLLMERGEIDLIDPVADYLPAFKDMKVMEQYTITAARRDITIFDLLHMTAGFDYGESGTGIAAAFEQIIQNLDSAKPYTTAAAAALFSQSPLCYHPGEAWTYGICADILGAIVETVSGKTLRCFLKEHFFIPLGMKDTDFYVPPAQQHRLATVYQTPGKLSPYNGNHLGIINKMDRPPAFESGGAGLVSTIDDYAAFAGMLLNEGRAGEKQILRPETVRYFTGGRLTAAQQQAFESDSLKRSGFSYANMLTVCLEPAQASYLARTGDYGWSGWLGCNFVNNPDDKTMLIYMQQVAGAGTTATYRRLKNIFYSHIQ